MSTTIATLSPVFGPERNTYLRMVYGTKSNQFGGVTAGRFYDLRGTPVPYKPFDATWFQLNLNDSSLDGKTAEVSVVHPESIVDGSSSQITVVLSYPISVFGMRLAHGMNWVKLTVDGAVIADCTVTATNYASLLHNSALQIYANVWQRLETLNADVFSGDSTRITSMLLAYDDHFSHAANVNRVSRSTLVNAIMNFPSSVRAVQAMAQAVLGTSVVVSDVIPRWLDRSWMAGGMSSAADAFPQGKVFTAWAPDYASAHFACIPFFAKASGLTVKVGKTTLNVDGLTHDMKALRSPSSIEYTAPTMWIELDDSEDVLDIDVWLMNRQYGRVQSPGLWDYPGSYFDSNTRFDSGRSLDNSTKSLDPAMLGYIGKKIVKRELIDHSGEPMIGVLDASSASYIVSAETDVLGLSWTDTLVWAFEATGTLSTSTIFNASKTFATTTTAATTAQKQSNAFGGTLVVGDTSAGHIHLTSTLTKGQIATAKSGVAVVFATQMPTDQKAKKHVHMISLTWRDGWHVSIDGNHGHDATINEVA